MGGERSDVLESSYFFPPQDPSPLLGVDFTQGRLAALWRLLAPFILLKS